MVQEIYPPNEGIDKIGREPAMRVVHVVQHLRGGGAEVLVRSLCAGLVAAGVDTRVVSIYADGLSTEERAALPYGLDTIGRRSRTDIAFFGRLVATLRRVRPTIVHAHISAGKYAGRAAAIAAGVPHIVFTEHGHDVDSRIAALAARALHLGTERFVTFSPDQRDAFAHRERVSPSRVVVIPNGVEPPPAADRAAIRAELGIAQDVLALYLPARMAPQKDQTLAIRALARAFPGGDGAAVLFLAGTGPDEAELRTLVREFGLGERVRFLGYRDDAPRLMRGMDAYVLASRWERMPLALGEAMLADLAVVSTPWEGSAAFLRDGETAIVSAAHEVDAFAAALRRAANPALRHALAVRARAFAAERFDMAKTVRAHVDLYRSLVGAGT